MDFFSLNDKINVLLRLTFQEFISKNLLEKFEDDIRNNHLN